MLPIIRVFPLLALLSFSGIVFAAQPAWPEHTPQRIHDTRITTLAGGESVRLSGLFNLHTGAPAEVHGGFAGTRISEPRELQNLLTFIAEHPSHFRVSPADLEIVSSGTSRGKSYLTAMQRIEGRPILGTRVLLRVGSSGKIIAWGADIISCGNMNWQASVTAEQAARLLAASAQVETYSIAEVKEIWLRDGLDLIPAYSVLLFETPGVRQPTGVVNALTGELLRSGDRLRHADIQATLSGPIYPRHPFTPAEIRPLQRVTARIDDDSTTALLTDTAGACAFTGLAEGLHPLDFAFDGPYFSIHDLQLDLWNNPDEQYDPFSIDSVCAAPGTLDLVLNPDSAGPSRAAINALYHLNLAHDWWVRIDSTLDMMETALRVYPDQTDPQFIENACFVPVWPPLQNFPIIIFGAGTADLSNFAALADVVYHEYNHSITYQFYPEYGMDFMIDAMHEGFSDYFACTLTGVPRIGTGILRSHPEVYFRTLVNSLRYPEDWEYEGHADGQILGGAMWEAREALGDTIVDPIFHSGRYGSPDDFDAYFMEVLIADDDNDDLADGTPHLVELLTAFQRHGIGNDITPPDGSDPQPLAALPQSPRIDGCYPNPFNPITTVHYSLPRSADVEFAVHDVLGRQVASVAVPQSAAGSHTLRLDLSSFSSGVYFVRMEALGQVATAKAVLMK